MTCFTCSIDELKSKVTNALDIDPSERPLSRAA